MKNKFNSLYKALGIEVKPLPSNYSPDSYAQQLMKDLPKKSDVSYSVGTNYKCETSSQEEKEEQNKY